MTIFNWKFDIFPFILVRISSRPSTEFNSLLLDNLSLENLLSIDSRIENEKVILCDQIYNLIKTTKDESSKNALITLKRNVFNRRDIDIVELDIVSKHIPQPILLQLQNYIKISKQFIELNQTLILEYDNSLISSRSQLKQLVQTADFKKGLLLSSPELADQLKKFLDKPISLFRKKEYQTELGLLKYLTRLYTKTTPFGSFTNIGIAELNSFSGKGTELSISGETESIVIINNAFFRTLEQEFLFINDVVLEINIYVNNSLRTSDSHYIFYNNSNNLDESFRKVERNPFIDHILELIESQDSHINLTEITSMIINQVDENKIAIERFLHNLLKIGILRVGLTSSSKIDQSQIFVNELDQQIKRKSPFVSNILNILKSLCNLKENYTMASFLERKLISKEAQLKIDQLAAEMAIQKAKSKFIVNAKSESGSQFKLSGIEVFASRNFFYEDTFKAAKLHIDQNELEGIVRSLNTLATKCLNIRLTPYSFLDANNLFVAHYERDTEVKLLDFFKFYYKSLVKSSNDNFEGKEDFNNLIKKEKEKLKGYKQKWINEINRLLEHYIDLDQHTVNLDEGFFNSIECPPTMSNITLERISNPYAALLQLFAKEKENGQKTMAYLDILTSGYGMGYSRFLNNPNFQSSLDQLRKWNQTFQEKDEIFIDNSDYSSFNVNIHPSLMPYELEQIGKEMPAPNENRKINLNDLVVRFNPRIKGVEIYHKPSNKKCRIFNSDFQKIDQRSELFQFLSAFDITQLPLYQDIINQINERYHQKSGITVLPRVIVLSQIIIQRRQWILPKDSIPQPMKKGCINYFLAIRKWRNELNIPSQVFVRHQWESRIDENHDLKRDDFKPQFIDFNNPFIFKLFEKIVFKLTKGLIIEEMLPDFQAQISTEKRETFSTEFLLQWRGHSME